MKGLYIHIPFCEHICFYCDFAKRVPKNTEMIDTYIEYLEKEIRSYHTQFPTIETIYIGGGTPSMLSAKQLEQLFSLLKDIHPIEYTIEVNPESYTHEKGILFKSYGINRISLGVQTFNPDILKALNRKHTNQQVYDTVHDLRQIGIENINLDLIYALPHQTLDDLAYDLRMIEKINPTHVSAYSLILEEKTVFYHEYLKGNFKPLDEDLEAMMYQRVIDGLTSIGYDHYEISNFCKPGFESKHNLIYWTLGEYIGCGLGAHGYIDGYRTQNQRHLNAYYTHFEQERIQQTEAMQLQDELIFGLRKRSGIDLETIKERYHIDLFKAYPKLNEHVQNGLIEIENHRLRLTNKGLFLGNQVFMVFI